ncbi:MAG: phosphopantetheine-binding protein [Syntrophobacteraceae bacterium]
MNRREFYERLEFILELEPNTINGTESLDDFEGWDSLAKLSFIAMGDADLGTIVSAKALLACKNVADLVNLFDGKLVR